VQAEGQGVAQMRACSCRAGAVRAEGRRARARKCGQWYTTLWRSFSSDTPKPRDSPSRLACATVDNDHCKIRAYAQQVIVGLGADALHVYGGLGRLCARRGVGARRLRFALCGALRCDLHLEQPINGQLLA